MYKCLCGKEFEKALSLNAHKGHCYMIPHSSKTKRVAWNKGLTKETDERVRRNVDHVARSRIGKYNLANTSEERKKEIYAKISDSMRKAHAEGRAHNIGESRWNNEPSYLEKFFMGVIENEFVDKNYTREYSVSKFSIDFAWVDKKLAIEIDGQQHDRYWYKERDERKDNLLNNLGWKVLRIRWVDMYHDPKKWIKIAKDFIDDAY